MIKDMVKFLILLALVLMTFACSGKIEFSVIEFDTFTDSMITLYSWMLGLFNFQQMESEGMNGILYLAFYLLVNMILLLNLLIAVLSNTFSMLVAQGVWLYLESIVEVLPLFTFHPRYNVLTYSVVSFNLLSFLCLTCLRKGTLRLSCSLKAITYFPLYLFVLLFYLGVNGVFFPFAFVSLLSRSIKRKKRARCLLECLLTPFLCLFLDLFDLTMLAIYL